MCGPFPSFGPSHQLWVGAATPPVRLELLASLTGKAILAEYCEEITLTAHDFSKAGV